MICIPNTHKCRKILASWKLDLFSQRLKNFVRVLHLLATTNIAKFQNGEIFFYIRSNKVKKGELQWSDESRTNSLHYISEYELMLLLKTNEV